MKTRSFKLLLMLFFSIIFSYQIKAQSSSACAQCIENNTECDIYVVITFYCNGAPCTNNAPVLIQSKTTYCPSWPSSGCSGCSTCDMEVELVGVNLNPPNCTYSTSNKVSISNPGPVNIPNSACDACFSPYNNPPRMQYSGNIFWIGGF